LLFNFIVKLYKFGFSIDHSFGFLILILSFLSFVEKVFVEIFLFLNETSIAKIPSKL